MGNAGRVHATKRPQVRAGVFRRGAQAVSQSIKANLKHPESP